VVGHPVLTASGELIEVVGTTVDVTERKRAEEEHETLRQLKADLAHMNRVSMLGEPASLSHELKQPIAAAITNAHTCLRWLKRDQPDLDEIREAAERMVQDGKRASLYKKSPPQRELVDVNEIVREMLGLLRREANRYSISMRTELAADLPKITADRVQLQQVFMNLMLNGIEAMKDSGGELTVKSQPGQDGQLLISVSDTGVGLPAEKADEIFNAFFTTKPQGSGMGLAISRSIVESHGGRLSTTNNSGQGNISLHFADHSRCGQIARHRNVTSGARKWFPETLEVKWARTGWSNRRAFLPAFLQNRAPSVLSRHRRSEHESFVQTPKMNCLQCLVWVGHRHGILRKGFVHQFCRHP
jgi:signal transduction histidine kinase